MRALVQVDGVTETGRCFELFHFFGSWVDDVDPAAVYGLVQDLEYTFLALQDGQHGYTSVAVK
jgi:hypothetical protein